MDDDALMARFGDAAERLTACRFIDWRDETSDHDVRNAIIVEQTEIGKEIRRRGMLARLLPFLDGADPSARLSPALAVCDAAAKAAAGWRRSPRMAISRSEPPQLENPRPLAQRAGDAVVVDVSGRMARRRALRYQGAS